MEKKDVGNGTMFCACPNGDCAGDDNNQEGWSCPDGLTSKDYSKMACSLRKNMCQISTLSTEKNINNCETEYNKCLEWSWDQESCSSVLETKRRLPNSRLGI